MAHFYFPLFNGYRNILQNNGLNIYYFSISVNDGNKKKSTHKKEKIIINLKQPNHLNLLLDFEFAKSS